MTCTELPGEYWCMCKGADNIMGREPRNAASLATITRCFCRFVFCSRRLDMRPLCSRPLDGGALILESLCVFLMGEEDVNHYALEARLVRV